LILACLLFWSIISYLLISRFVFQATEIVGSSMEPTLCPGARYVINRWIYRFRNPRRNEIITVWVPIHDEPSVKRIIALPDDSVEIRDEHVCINGYKIEEPYLMPGTHTVPGLVSTNAYVVEAGCYFVLGDNRGQSVDSRSFGAVRKEWITGRVIVRERRTGHGVVVRRSRRPGTRHVSARQTVR